MAVTHQRQFEIRAPAASAQTAGASSIRWLREHPIAGYFLFAFGLQWIWWIPLLVVMHQEVLGLWQILSPTAAGLLMALATGGRAGLVDVLRRSIRWRVGIGLYSDVLLTIPALYLLGLAAAPGAMAGFQIPSADFLSMYAASFAFGLFGAGVGEEPGWRGFALPRLQRLLGALPGTLVLGSLWGLWHLPLWLFVPRHSGARAGFLGMLVPFLGWFAFIVAFAVIITWVFNHARQSVLLAMLFHASINSSYDTLPIGFFPTLFPPDVAAHSAMPLLTEAGVVLFALMIVLCTRRMLGYDTQRDHRVHGG
jgi:membrane protease YdiL (CAAX protease family)